MKDSHFLLALCGIGSFITALIGKYILKVDPLLAVSLPLLMFIGMICGYQIAGLD